MTGPLEAWKARQVRCWLAGRWVQRVRSDRHPKIVIYDKFGRRGVFCFRVSRPKKRIFV